MSENPKKDGRKIRRTKLLYDLNLKDRQVVIRASFILDPLPVTPITSLLEQRLIKDDDVKAIPRRNFSPRQFITTSAESKVRTVFAPYRPSDINLINHLKELNILPEIECIDYKGETFNESNLGDYL
jgi:hypothetical protein